MKIERQTVHVNDDTGRIAMLEKRIFDNAADDNDTAESLERFVYSNHLQSASLELDEDGAIISYEEYHPYGTTSYQANNSDIKAIAKRYHYTGKERDEESGLYYHGARYYIPWLGRWTAVDPLVGNAPEWSSYNAMWNNPINYIDGNWAWSVWVRSFISTPTTGGGYFRGDDRESSTETNKDITSRVWLNFIYDATNPEIINYEIKSDYTLFYGHFPQLLPIIDVGDPIVEFTKININKNYFGNNIGSFGLHYWGKDPVTPQRITPSLDVHVNFTITENLKREMLYINATIIGDTFPSTEAFIEDQSGFRLLLGARKEEGGVINLIGDNKLFLFDVNMQIKLNKEGGFLGIYDEKRDTYISPDTWNKQIQSQWHKPNE